MIALSQEEEDAQAFMEVVRKACPNMDVRLLHATYDGVYCEVI